MLIEELKKRIGAAHPEIVEVFERVFGEEEFNWVTVVDELGFQTLLTLVSFIPEFVPEQVLYNFIKWSMGWLLDSVDDKKVIDLTALLDDVITYLHSGRSSDYEDVVDSFISTFNSVSKLNYLLVGIEEFFEYIRTESPDSIVDSALAISSSLEDNKSFANSAQGWFSRVTMADWE